MRPRDILDHFKLRRYLENPGAYWEARRSREPGLEVELRLRPREPRRAHSLFLRRVTHDAHRFHRIYLMDVYRVGDLGRDTADCIIEIGANAGIFTTRAAPHARVVHCFEPVPSNARLLKRNLSQDAFKHVHFHQAAVTGGEKSMRIYLSDNPGGHSGVAQVGEDYVEVEGVPLEAFLRDTPIPQCDLMKIDCEGGEYPILYSLSPESLGRIKRIHMEYHAVPPPESGAEGGYSWDIDGLKRFLEEHGFRVDDQPSRRKPGKGMLFADKA